MKTRSARSFLAYLAITFSVGGTFAAGCGTNTSRFGDGGAGGDGSAKGDSNTFGTDSGPPCAVHCSSDLHSILDCNDNVYKTCPDNQGCNGETCVSPCDAAKANKSSIGCDYYAVNPDTSYAAGACFAAFIANTWTSPVRISVDYAGQALTASTFTRVPQGSGRSITYQPLTNGKLDPGQVAVVFLAQFGPQSIYTPACPAGVTAGVTASDAAPHGTSIGKAFHIVTDAPVVAYDIFPYGGGVSAITSATLLLPTSAWDTNYIAVDAYAGSTGGTVGSNSPFLDVVAAEDATQITISPTAAIMAGTGVVGSPLGVPVSYTINKGQVLHFNQNAELTGSPIQSDKPIAVFGGNSCMGVPISQSACDAAHQQIPPVRALGHEYVAVRYRNRFPGIEESPPWRVVGAVDRTTLTYEPSAPVGAPTTLASGQMAEFKASSPFVVTSQDDKHPFYLGGYMTGAGEVDQTFGDGRGDPEFVNVIPPQEYLASYIFFTDPTYPETNLVLVRTKAKDGTFKDVNLDCLGGPVEGWKPIGTSGNYEFARVDLVTGNFSKVAGCDNGRREIHSAAAFGLTVWGWGSSVTGGGVDPDDLSSGFYSQYVSYAYPAGASVHPINAVVVTPIPR